MSTKPFSSTLCPEKTQLLAEYVAALNIHGRDVKEYSNTVRDGLDGNILETFVERMQKSRERTAFARERYVSHLREHGCDIPI